jgi:predicted transcriptional regulator
MATLEIPDELAKTLNLIAKREGRTVEEIAKSALGQFRDAHWIPAAEPEDLV